MSLPKWQSVGPSMDSLRIVHTNPASFFFFFDKFIRLIEQKTVFDIEVKQDLWYNILSCLPCQKWRCIQCAKCKDYDSELQLV